MSEKLTERLVERLTCEDGKRDRLVFDSVQRGLGVRVVASGSKTYLAQYTLAGQKHRVPLGSTDAISLAAARSAAQAVMGDVAKGRNPAADRKAAVEEAKAEAARERLTLERLVSEWERLHLLTRRPSYRAEAVGALKRAFATHWPKAAERLTRKDVVAVIDCLPPAMARATAAYGRACFSWALKRGDQGLQGNPFEALPVSAVEKRDRVLTDAEVVAIWNAADGTPAPFGPIVKMLLLTGQRREEVGGMAWAELSEDLTLWTIPPERAKNGQASIIALPPPAVRLLEARLAVVRGNRAGFVFPGAGGKQFGGWSKSKAALDKVSGTGDWRLHDLRRTVATGLQRLGVRLEVTEAVLNHVSGSRAGIVGIYQRHNWADEKREALASWADHLLALVQRGAGLRLVA